MRVSADSNAVWITMWLYTAYNKAQARAARHDVWRKYITPGHGEHAVSTAEAIHPFAPHHILRFPFPSIIAGDISLIGPRTNVKRRSLRHAE